MDKEEISKKELLETMGISYGQLYRWKRKNLIPEDWFIRRSTFTGQETFFPRAKIVARIAKIMNMKDDLSLDELADVFSPSTADMTKTSEQLIEQNIVSKTAIELFTEQHGAVSAFSFTQILFLYLLDKALLSGTINQAEGALLLQTLHTHFPACEGKSCELLFLRKMGITTCLLIAGTGELFVDQGAAVVLRMSVAASLEELKVKLSGM